MLFLPLLILCTLYSFSQSKEDQVKQLIFKKDSVFWVAYNSCDINGMAALLSDDVEFYHDKGGPSFGRDTLMKTIKKNLCSNHQFRLRREAVKGTVKVFVMNSSDTAYGAIISGDHMFYITENGKKEYRSGQAKFAQLWILKNGEWKMTRILSYDHGPAPQDNTRVEKQVSAAVLDKHAGKYKGPNFTIEAVNDKGVLKLKVDGKEFILHPASDDVFFVTDRDLEFVFSPKKLTVKEHGAVVEEAVKL